MIVDLGSFSSEIKWQLTFMARSSHSSLFSENIPVWTVILQDGLAS